jgi:hypothetical protein
MMAGPSSTQNSATPGDVHLILDKHASNDASFRFVSDMFVEQPGFDPAHRYRPRNRRDCRV